MRLGVRHGAQNGLLDRVRHGLIRALVALGVAAFAGIEMVLAVGALQDLDPFAGFFDRESLADGFVGLQFGHTEGYV